MLTVYEKQVYWFHWKEGAYVSVEPDEGGIYRSRMFPGLWLNAPAFWAGQLDQVLATLQTCLHQPN